MPESDEMPDDLVPEDDDDFILPVGIDLFSGGWTGLTILLGITFCGFVSALIEIRKSLSGVGL